MSYYCINMCISLWRMTLTLMMTLSIEGHLFIGVPFNILIYGYEVIVWMFHCNMYHLLQSWHVGCCHWPWPLTMTLTFWEGHGSSYKHMAWYQQKCSRITSKHPSETVFFMVLHIFIILQMVAMATVFKLSKMPEYKIIWRSDINLGHM